MQTESTGKFRVRSCAKINLTLDVFSKRSDGYHSIASVLQTISLFDTIQIAFSNTSGIEFSCDGDQAEHCPVDDTNLVVRAAKLLQEKIGVSHGLCIHLHKKIPAQAGLGGGSSNAAATLIGVNQMLGCQLESKELHELAASLGSDVPFFLYGGTAVARGRGEQITLLDDAPQIWLVVVKPDECVSTGWAYGAMDEMKNRSSHRATKRMEEALESQDETRIINLLCNDFEAVVFERYPKIAWLHDELRMAGAVSAHLCGSGSAVYGIVKNELEAHRIAKLLQISYRNTYLARTISSEESDPLLGMLR